MNPKVEIKHLASDGRELRVQQVSGPVLQLGRSPDSDIAFDPDRERSVSGRHAELRVDGAVLTVVDVGSRNGTFVNGERLRGARTLSPGDRVRLGDTGPEFTAALVADPTATKVASGAAGAHAAAAGSGRAIGEQTLRRVLLQVVRRERRRTALMLAGLVAIGALAWGVFGNPPTAPQDGAGSGSVGGTDPAADAGSGHGAPGTTVAGPGQARTASERTGTGSTGSRRTSTAEDAPVAFEWSELLRQDAPSVYLVVRRGTVEGEQVEQAFGTAWVVAPGTLATNAHIAGRLGSSASLLVRSNATQPRDFPVESIVVHPGYGEFVDLLRRYQPFDANTGQFLNLEPAFDVALLRVAGDPGALSPALPLATDAVLADLVAGQELASIGYPKEGMQAGGTDVRRPEPTTDIKPLTRLSDVFFSKARSADEALNLTYGFVAVGGSSGSPVLDQRGLIVGMIASGNVLTDGDRGRISVDGSCHGPRADLVRELLDGSAAERQARRREGIERAFLRRFLAGTSTPRLFARCLVRRLGGGLPDLADFEIAAEVEGVVAPGATAELGPLRVRQAGDHRVVVLCRDRPVRPVVRLRQAAGPWSSEQVAERYWWVSAPVSLRPERPLELSIRVEATAGSGPVQVAALVLRDP